MVGVACGCGLINYCTALLCRYCKKCQTHRPARKTLEVWKLPPVLVRGGEGERE